VTGTSAPPKVPSFNFPLVNILYVIFIETQQLNKKVFVLKGFLKKIENYCISVSKILGNNMAKRLKGHFKEFSTIQQLTLMKQFILNFIY
jgi:hypothetical protein